MPITRSSELLNFVDGLFFIDQNVIDVAAKFYCELRTTINTFGEQAVEKLLPHVTSLMNSLNELSKENADVKHELEVLRDSLSLAESRCVGLDTSFKGKALECCQLEDEYEVRIKDLTTQLSKCKEDNMRLLESARGTINTDMEKMVEECHEKITALTSERRCLLTTIEVLEADLKCLRGDLRRMESRAKQRKASTADDLLLELSLSPSSAESMQASKPASETLFNGPSHLGSSEDKDRPVPNASGPLGEFKNVLVIGDSLLRYSSYTSVCKGAQLECCPGGKIMDIKNRLLEYVGVSLNVIYFHVGTNNLRRGFRGGPAYNGGHGKREALHSMADLLYTARTNFPDTKVFLNSILVRRDIASKPLFHFNEQLELMCSNFGVEFVNAGGCVRRDDLARDGVHLSRRGNSRLGLLIADAISSYLESMNATAASSLSFQDDSAPSLPLDPFPVGNITSGSALSQVSGN